MHKKIEILLISFIIIVLSGLGIFYHNKRNEVKNEKHVYSEEQLDLQFDSAWLPYWDYNNAKLDWKIQKYAPKEVVSFGVMYEGEELYVPEETDLMTKELVQMELEETDIYLSFINDVRQKDGSFVQKDKSFLESFMPHEDKRTAYIDDIIELAVDYKVDGVELDYENIKNDKKLYQEFALFVEELNKKCEESDLKLRVVLSYDSARYVEFPSGPHYVIMCYNLFGPHSGPGPKADKAFLEETFDINDGLKPEVSMAYSNNGFSWSEAGEINAVTKREALAMAEVYDADIIRDEASSALYYEYQDNQGEKYQVWFADDRTLYDWISWSKDAGYDAAALWRYGK